MLWFVAITEVAITWTFLPGRVRARWWDRSLRRMRCRLCWREDARSRLFPTRDKSHGSTRQAAIVIWLGRFRIASSQGISNPLASAPVRAIASQIAKSSSFPSAQNSIDNTKRDVQYLFQGETPSQREHKGAAHCRSILGCGHGACLVVLCAGSRNGMPARCCCDSGAGGS